MNHVVKWSLSSLLVAASSVASAQISLPMKYFPDATIQNPPGDAARLYVGASTESVNGEIVVKPSGTLYVAPNSGKVTANGFHRYATANCSVVDNERANERTASDLYKFQIEQYASLVKDLKTYNDEAKQANDACLKAMRNHEPTFKDTCDYAREVKRVVDDMSSQLTPWSSQIASLSSDITARLETLGHQVGGFAAATVSLYSPETLTAVKQVNPNFNATWVGIRDVDFAFTTAEEGLSSPESAISMRTTLGFSLVGEPLPDTQMNGSVGAKNAIKSGGNVALGITLSRLGACDDKLLRAGVFFYKFDSFSYVKGTAKINRWAVYEKLEKNSTKGGFFSTKAVHELYEDFKGGQTQEVIVEGVPDTDFNEERKKLEADVLNDLLTEMATAQPMAVNKALLGDLPVPGQNGASAIGDGLQKCPHIYCQVGGFVLKSLSAIFGSTEQRDEIKRSQNFKAERRYAYNKRHDETGSAATLVSWSN